ncbi:hypothetical protein FQA39_LY04816 [Lamprigera yunnana]|nr:hypothetical protein FQA39_LY04816 [Lamprigera yunnana]
MAANNENKIFKSHFLNGGPSVQQFRDDIRNKLRRKIKEARYREMCQTRQLLPSVASDVNIFYSNVRQEFSHNFQEVTAEEMLKSILEIELELLNNLPYLEIEEQALNLEHKTRETI